MKNLDPEAAPHPRLACSSPHLYMNITNSHHIGGPRWGPKDVRMTFIYPEGLQTRWG